MELEFLEIGSKVEPGTGCPIVGTSELLRWGQFLGLNVFARVGCF